MFASQVNRRVARLVLVALGGLLLCGFALEGTTLRWRFEPGQVRRYEMVQKTSSTMMVDGQEFQTEQELRTEITWRVKEVGSDGSARLEQTIDRVRIWMEVPMGRVEYDSDRPDEMKLPEPQDAMRPMISIFEALVDQPITSVMTARGEVRDLEIAEGFRKGLEKAAGPASGMLGELLSEQGLKKLSGFSGTSFPEEAVEKGSSWTTGGSSKLGALGVLKLEVKHTYEGPAEVESKPVEKIGIEVSMTSEPSSGDNRSALSLDETEAKGTVLFDNQEGTMVASELTQRMKMTIQVEAQKAEQWLTTQTSMKLLPPGTGPAR